MKPNPLVSAVGTFLDHAPREFESHDVVLACPAFKPAALRGHLHWLVTCGKLVSFRGERGVLIYCMRNEAPEGQGEPFYCSEELILAMRRLSSHEPIRARPQSPPRVPDDIARVFAVIARIRSASSY